VVDWANRVLFVLEFKRTSDHNGITEHKGNLEHWVNITFSSETSRRWRETRRVIEEVGRSS
jgi:hypothetical protein